MGKRSNCRGMFTARAYGFLYGLLCIGIASCAPAGGPTGLTAPPPSSTNPPSSAHKIVANIAMRGADGAFTNHTVVVNSIPIRAAPVVASDSLLINGRMIHAADVVVQHGRDTTRVFIQGQLVTLTTTSALEQHMVVYQDGRSVMDAHFTRPDTTVPWGFSSASVGANLQSPCWWLAIQLAAAAAAMVAGCSTLDPLVCVPASIAYVGLQGQWNEQCGPGELREAAFVDRWARNFISVSKT